MPEKDPVRPYHAKDTAPGQEAADVVAEVLKHAQEREQAVQKRQVPKGPPKWMLPFTVNLGVLALYFLIAQPRFLEVNPINDPRSEAVQVEQTRFAMYLDGIARIEQFRAENGRLPTSLEEANSSLARAGVDYSIRGDSSYLLVTTVGSETSLFDSSAQTAAEFAPNLSPAISR